jgi:hypothetical protein
MVSDWGQQALAMKWFLEQTSSPMVFHAASVSRSMYQPDWLHLRQATQGEDGCCMAPAGQHGMLIAWRDTFELSQYLQ